MTLLASSINVSGQDGKAVVVKRPVISPAFLEFLASLEEVDGQLISPMDLPDTDMSELAELAPPAQIKPAGKPPVKPDTASKKPCGEKGEQQ